MRSSFTPDMSKEMRNTVLMLMFSFFMGTALALFFTVSISSFLISFSGKVLPYVYLCAGVLNYVLWNIYHQLSRYFRFSRLLYIVMVLLLISVVAFTIAVYSNNVSWLPFLLMTWVSPFLFIRNVCFWGMASRLFNISQGKRLFGLINSGEVISNVIGFFTVPVLLPILGTTGLLVISTMAVFFCITIAVILILFNKDVFVTTEKTTITARTVKKDNVPGTNRDHFFLLTVAFAMLPIVLFYFIDYIFLNLAQQEFSDVTELATFMGYFLGAVSTAELLFKSILFGRILTHYGLKAGMLCLPVPMLFATLLVIITGHLAESSYLFFSVIAFSKLLERSLSNGIHLPATQIIYQPLPVSVRTVFQGKVEGLSQALGNITAGGLLLLLSLFAVTDLLFYNYALLFILTALVLTAIPLYKSYQNQLREVLLRKRTIQPAREWVPASHIFRKGLTSANPDITMACSLLLREATQPQNTAVSQSDLNNKPEEEILLRIEHDLLEEMSETVVDENAVNEFRTIFSRAYSPSLRMKVLKDYLKADTRRARSFLLSQLEYPDRQFQLAVIKLLYAIKYTVITEEQPRIRQKILETAETITWLEACMLDLEKESAAAPLIRSLKNERKEYFETLYRLLSFAYGYATVDLIKSNLLDKSDTESHVYAMEVAMNAFDKDILSAITPWFEHLPPHRSLDKLAGIFPQQRMSVPARGINILYRDYSRITLWTKANALNLLEGYYKDQDVRNEIVACLFHHAAIIREIAFVILTRNAADIDVRPELLPGPQRNEEPVFNKVSLLKEIPLFHLSPAHQLIPLATQFQVYPLFEGQTLPVGEECIILLSGRLSFLKSSEAVFQIQPHQVFMQGISHLQPADMLRAENDSRILVCSKRNVMSFFFEDPLLSRGLLKYVSEGIHNRRITIQKAPFTQ